MQAVLTVQTAQTHATLEQLARMECHGRCEVREDLSASTPDMSGKRRVIVTFDNPGDRLRFRRALCDLPAPLPGAIITGDSAAGRAGFLARIFF